MNQQTFKYRKLIMEKKVMLQKLQVTYQIVSTNLLAIMFVFAVLSGNLMAQKNQISGKKYIGKPVTLARLKTNLERKSYKNSEIIDVIESSGVDFVLTDNDEAELKEIGATGPIIAAIKENRRTDSDDKGVTLGVINGKATRLPDPKYPAAGRALHLSGVVNVFVIVTKEGSVFSAETISGHPLLRKAAEDAARDAKFQPLLINGKPQVFKGTIVYNFIAQ